jgi:outer membrane protein assembly factor BamD
LTTRVAILTFLVLSLTGWTHPAQTVLRSAGTSDTTDTAVDDPADETASKQMEVARYYIGKRDYPGAINRLKTVLTRFPTSRYVEEALAHLAESYLALGIASEARTAAAVLGRKFPDGYWSADAHDALASAGLEAAEDEKSWISQIFK